MRWRWPAGDAVLGLRPYAGFARRPDLRSLTVSAAVPGRVTLGTAHGRMLAAEPQASLAVIGPTGSGKTVGLAIPAVLAWPGPVLVTSVKADVLAATFAHRTRNGTVTVVDPAGAAGPSVLPWTPLASCRDWPGAMRTAAWLCEAAGADLRAGGEGSFWPGQARKALAPYLFAAALGGRTMLDVVAWVDAAERDAVEQVMHDAMRRPGDDHAALGAADALTAAQSLWAREARLRDSVFATVQNVVAPYAETVVGGRRPDDGLDFSAWLSGAHTMYVVAPGHEQGRLRPVLSMVVAQAIRCAFETAVRRGGALEHPLLVVLDEAGNIAPLPELPACAATARSHGITLVTIWQDLAQLEALYGRRARTLLNNHRAKFFGAGIADQATLDALSALVGDVARVERATSRDVGGARGRRSMSEHTAYRRAASADVLRRLPVGEGVLVYGSLLPAHVRLLPPQVRGDAAVR